MSDQYLAAVRRVDAAVGALTSRLGDETLLIVSDHGGGGLEPRDHDRPHPLNERIPFIMAGHRVKRRLVVQREVLLLDVPPTVMAVLGVPIPAEYEGEAMTEALLPESAVIAEPMRVAS